MDRQSIQLKLAPREATMLGESLATLLADIRHEIAHTDDAHYRDGLYARLDTLETIQRRLSLEVSS
jgi:hypothetical protein